MAASILWNWVCAVNLLGVKKSDVPRETADDGYVKAIREQLLASFGFLLRHEGRAG